MGGANTKDGATFEKNTSGQDPLVIAWNNAVGFKQLTGPLHTTFEEFVAQLDDVQIMAYEESMLQDYLIQPDSKIMFVCNVDYGEFEEGEPSDGIISIARHMLYDPRFDDPIPLDNVNLEQKYNILSGFCILHNPINSEEFAHRIQTPSNLSRQYLVRFQNRELFFVIRDRPIYSNSVKIGLSGNKQCLKWKLNLQKKSGYIASLFYAVDKKECFGADKVSGNWVLDFIDHIQNDCLYFEVSRLTDGSTFLIDNKQYSAACVYASTHNGLSWYMSHHYIMNKEDFETSLEATNQEIRDVVEWWNNQRLNKSTQSAHACERYNNTMTSMIKYYKILLECDIPPDKSLPAYFRRASDLTTQADLKTPDRHFNTFYFGLLDVLHVLPKLTYELIPKDELKYFVVRKVGLVDNCQFDISDARELVRGTRQNRHDPTLSFLQSVAMQKNFLFENYIPLYFKSLFPILQACHQRYKLKKPKNTSYFRSNNDLCEKISASCVAPAEFKISADCGSYCAKHFYDSIQTFVEAIQLVAFSNDEMEIVGQLPMFTLEDLKTHQFNTLINETFKVENLKTKNINDIIETFLNMPYETTYILGCYYRVAIIPDNITKITSYFNNYEFEISLVPQFMNEHVIKLEFTITSPKPSTFRNMVDFVKRKVRPRHDSENDESDNENSEEEPEDEESDNEDSEEQPEDEVNSYSEDQPQQGWEEWERIMGTHDK